MWADHDTRLLHRLSDRGVDERLAELHTARGQIERLSVLSLLNDQYPLVVLDHDEDERVAVDGALRHHAPPTPSLCVR